MDYEFCKNITIVLRFILDALRNGYMDVNQYNEANHALDSLEHSMPANLLDD